MKQLTRDDILDPDAYNAVRADRRREITGKKKHRRIGIGPHATFYFESYETMWYQVHEMVRIEKGGEAQITDELEAYNPLIPNGQELVATVMFEIADADQRAKVLATLGGVEETFSLDVEGEIIEGVPEADVDRTTADGKASSVQFVHFPFTQEQIEKFRTPGARVVLAIGHSNYGHMAVIPEDSRAALSEDFE